MPPHETEEKLRKLAPSDAAQADLNWLFYLSGEAEERQNADELLDILLYQNLNKDFREKIFLDPAPAPDCVGEYSFGKIEYPPGKTYCEFGLRENEWIKHLLITGMSGTGKTNLAFQILRELKKKNKPFMVFDWKRNYRDLLQLPEFIGTAVFTIGREICPFYFNPLIPPPGTLPGQWLMKLVDVIKHAYFVGEGVEYLLREAIDWVYQECGFFGHTAPKPKTPTFSQVKDYIHKKRLQGRMGLWKASCIRVLESLCFRHGLGNVVNTENKIDQEPGKLSNSIKANTYCKITFNLGNGKDILEISNCMALSKEESEYINLLDVGQAIVTLKGRVFVPLYLVIPWIEVRKGMIGDGDICT